MRRGYSSGSSRVNDLRPPARGLIVMNVPPPVGTDLTPEQLVGLAPIPADLGKALEPIEQLIARVERHAEAQWRYERDMPWDRQCAIDQVRHL